MVCKGMEANGFLFAEGQMPLTKVPFGMPFSKILRVGLLTTLIVEGVC